MSYIPLVSDSGNRSNGSLIGSALDNAAGGGSLSTVWAGAAGFAVSGNKIINASGTVDIAYPSGASAVDKQRSSITVSGLGTWVVVRLDPGTGNCYLFGKDTDGLGHLYLHFSGGFFPVGSATGAVANGTVLTLEGDGSTLNCYYDGVLVSSPTDGTLATGVQGILCNGSGTFSGDNFLAELWSAGGVATKLGITTQPPGSVWSREVHANVVVEIQDAGGSRVSSSTDSVTIASTNTSAGLSVFQRYGSAGTLTKNAVAGVATFDDLSIECSDTNKLTTTGTYTATSGVLTPATTNSMSGRVRGQTALTVTAAAGPLASITLNKLTSSINGGSPTDTVVATGYDIDGNVVTSFRPYYFSDDLRKVHVGELTGVITYVGINTGLANIHAFDAGDPEPTYDAGTQTSVFAPDFNAITIGSDHGFADMIAAGWSEAANLGVQDTDNLPDGANHVLSTTRHDGTTGQVMQLEYAGVHTTDDPGEEVRAWRHRMEGDTLCTLPNHAFYKTWYEKIVVSPDIDEGFPTGTVSSRVIHIKHDEDFDGYGRPQFMWLSSIYGQNPWPVAGGIGAASGATVIGCFGNTGGTNGNAACQARGPWLREVQNAWFRYTTKILLHTPNAGTMSVTVIDATSAAATFSVSQAGEPTMVNGAWMTINDPNGHVLYPMIVSDYDGSTHCTLTSAQVPGTFDGPYSGLTYSTIGDAEAQVWLNGVLVVNVKKAHVDLPMPGARPSAHPYSGGPLWCTKFDLFSFPPGTDTPYAPEPRLFRHTDHITLGSVWNGGTDGFPFKLQWDAMRWWRD